MNMKNQPTPAAIANQRNCSNCAFSIETREPPPSIQKMRVCRWGPPHMVPTFGPQGITLNVMFPPVNETLLCHQHRFHAEIANGNSSPTGGPPN